MILDSIRPVDHLHEPCPAYAGSSCALQIRSIFCCIMQRRIFYCLSLLRDDGWPSLQGRSRDQARLATCSGRSRRGHQYRCRNR